MDARQGRGKYAPKQSLCIHFQAIGATKHAGPRRRHANPVGPQTTQHPIFVLQLQCGTEEYDLLLEPDKTIASFANERLLRQCLAALVLTMLDNYVRISQIRDLVKRVFEAPNTAIGDSIASPYGRGLDVTLGEGREGSEEDADPYYYYSNTASPVDSNVDLCPSPLGNKYHSTFLLARVPLATTVPSPRAAPKKDH